MSIVDPGPIPDFLDRNKNKPLVGTYTMLHCFGDICPHQAYHRYVAKTLPYVETPAMAWGNLVHASFEHRVGGGKPLPANVQAWNEQQKKHEPFNMQAWEPFAAAFDGYGAQVEIKLGMTAEGQPCGFFDDKVRFRVKVDVALVNGESAYIADWKTGGSKYEDPFEIAIGAMHLHAKYPQLKTISGNYVWLKENRLGQRYDLSDTLSTWKRVNHLLNAMEQARRENNWPKKQGPLCGFCDVLSCENNRRQK